MRRWLPSTPFAAPRELPRRVEVAPPVALALTFLVLILVGAGILMLPAAVTRPISASDALFTATSAVTVTGLVVVDTGSEFTRLGQWVILALMQLGGLGLMTFAVTVLTLLGQRVGLRSLMVVREELNQTSFARLGRILKATAGVSLVCEMAGWCALAARMVPDFGWREGSFQALFHTVSAFNNAGFSLFPDSLSRYVGDPLINLAVPALFIVGGLGFVVLEDLWTHRGRFRRLSLHSKLVLVGTAVLIVWGTVAVAWLEWDNPRTLGGLPSWHDRLWAAWFQGVTTRTAGFNTIDIGAIEPATSVLMICLMFIGGGTASTAGGIKVTTFVVLILATLAFLRRHPLPHVFGRTVQQEELTKVLALTVLGVLLVMLAVFLLCVGHREPFLDVAFEATSALGTVGLSRGGTGHFDAFGRAVLMVLMFVGRIGPLGLGFMLATSARGRVRYPRGRVYFG